MSQIASSHPGNYNNNNHNEDSSCLSSTMYTARSAFEDEKSEFSSVMGSASVSTSVRAMKQKFEQASKLKGDAPRKLLSCGSPVAERRRQLQQVLLLDKDDTSDSSQTSANKDGEKELTQSSDREKAFNADKKGRNFSRVVADRKKMFEKTSLSTMKRYTKGSADDSLQHKISGQGSASTMAISESDLSAPEYDGAMFQDDIPQATRDEVEARRRPRVSETRDSLEPQRVMVQNRGYPCTIFPHNDSFEDVFQGTEDQEEPVNEPQDEFMTDAAEETTQRTLPFQHTTTWSPCEPYQHSKWGPEQHGFAQDKASTLSPDNSFQEALDEIVQSFQDDRSAKGSRSPPHDYENEMIFRDSAEPSAVFFLEKSRADAPSLVSMLTSFESDTEPACHRQHILSSQDPRAMSSDDKDTSRVSVVKTATTRSSSEVLPNSSVFSTVEQEEGREQAKSQIQKGNNPYELFKKQIVAETPMRSEPKYEYQEYDREKQGAQVAAKQRRYEITDESIHEGARQIKGILKNRLLNKSEEPLSRHIYPLSSASWGSSASSLATSEITQHLSPLGHSRFSIGGYVNAHLAKNPPRDEESKSEAPSREGKREQRSTLKNRERVDSVASSHEAYPSSMEAQHGDESVQRRPKKHVRELASCMSSMANTSANAVIDVLVDATEKVVVFPLLSLFQCVDQSEGLLCNGTTPTDDVIYFRRQRHSRRGRRARSRTRKFNA